MSERIDDPTPIARSLQIAPMQSREKVDCNLKSYQMTKAQKERKDEMLFLTQWLEYGIKKNNLFNGKAELSADYCLERLQELLVQCKRNQS